LVKKSPWKLAVLIGVGFKYEAESIAWRMRWTGHVAQMGRKEMHIGIWKPEGK
jgi:hypothetical protein